MRREIIESAARIGHAGEVLTPICTPGTKCGGAAQSSAAWTRLSILVAEDDPCDALLLEQALLKAGLHVPVQFVNNGQEALDYFAGEPPFADRSLYPIPTLLVLDLKMPGVDGFEVLDWLRHQTQLAGTLVVVLSGSEDTADIERAYAL